VAENWFRHGLLVHGGNEISVVSSDFNFGQLQQEEEHADNPCN